MKILLAVDDSKFSKAAAKSVKTLAPPRSQVRVLHVVEPPPTLVAREMAGTVSELRAVWGEQRKAAETLAAKIAGELRSKDLAVKTLVMQGDPRSRIVDAASKWKADLIVIGSHGRKGLERFLMGSVSDAVVHHAPCSVMVVRTGRAR